jgi:hypothetical protein
LNVPDEGDPDADGISNLMEYALNLDPNVSTSTGLPVVEKVADPVGQSSGTYIAMTLLRARTDITYEIFWSTDLQQWNLWETNPGTLGGEVTSYRPFSGTKEFLRLRVTLVP